MIITDCIVEIGLEAIRSKVISFESEKKIKQRLKNFIEHQYQGNIDCTKEEEIDFAKLAYYIRSELPKDVEVCLFGESMERKRAQDNIVQKAISYARANKLLSCERTIKMVESAIDIIRNFYSIQINKDLLFVAARIEDTIAYEIEQREIKQDEKVEKLIKKTEEVIITAVNSTTSMLENLSMQYKKEDVLPHNLTKSVALFANEQKVIHRENELNDIECMLKEKRIALLLSGFGGIGKTALARVLYEKSSNWFDCIGWVEYHKDLKNSLLSSMDIENEIEDQDKRWNKIFTRLKNNLSSKIIFIDNVDYDAKQKQDPQKDTYLQEITGWANTTIILTTRMTELHGYQTYSIGYLGSQNQFEPCVDVFYFYYDKKEFKKRREERNQRDLVEKLVAYAGFHTYAIELLARSAVYEDKLSDYLKKLKELGFKFPSLKISTDYSSDSMTAAKQLGLLFNMQSRTQKERQIVWDFSVLPEGTNLSCDDVRELLAYSENDLHRLCQEGWLIYDRGQGFYIHPLVREAILLRLRKGKAPYQTVSHLKTLVYENTLISEHNTQADIMRKLHIVESVLNYIAFRNKEEFSKFYYYLGIIEFKTARKRLTSIKYLEKALQNSQDMNFTAYIRYQLGYVKSATYQYRNKAKDDLQSALDIWQSLDGCEYEIAMAHDHLGYVLTDFELTYKESKDHLVKAMNMRKAFVDTDPTSKNLSAYATTCDNLGFLLYKAGNSMSESRQYLEKALSIREKLYETSEQYATDVAWTAFNLGQLLSKNLHNHAEAEIYFRRSLDIRRDLERKHPQMYTANIVFTLVSLAKLVATNSERLDEVKRLFDEVVTLKSDIDLNHVGFFQDDIEKDIRMLSELLNQQN
ncbi:MAG: tetratricopeptide repeat protein [Bacteroides sp.]|nr:tetratricopeptide repeat protein [Bacteroides sp.]MCM1548875.1 tetratricopeptide repeat protein [Clostridium sp.]